MNRNKTEGVFKKRNRMSADVNQSIVNGILQGYKNYLE